MKINAVIFDQDGVLIDSEPIHFLALSKFFKEHNEVYDLAIHETYFGYSGHNFFTQMREKHGVSMPVEYMKSKSRQYIHEFESQIQLMPEVHSSLEELNQGIPDAWQILLFSKIITESGFKFDRKDLGF